MAKAVWTAISAAKELGISKRHIYRCLPIAGIKPSWLLGKKKFYILGASDLEAIRAVMRKAE